MTNPRHDIPSECDLLTSIVDNAGVTRVKLVPARRLKSVSIRGIGLSPAFATMCVDDSIAAINDSSPVGDMRLIPDFTAIARIGENLSWAPADQLDQELVPLPTCQRSAVRRLTETAREAGFEFKMAFEFEFTVYEQGAEPGQARVAHTGPGYGLAPFLKLEPFLVDLLRALEDAGVEVEVIHPEYGKGQIEVSVTPTDPIEAADRSVLARLVTMRTAGRHGLRVSFAPITGVSEIGNGAHLHFSATNGDGNVFSGGDREFGMTDAGAHMIAGVMDNLGDATAIFAPSPVSFERLAPGMWSGAWACWGLDNREAALRFIKGTAGHGNSSANCEVKLVDPAANPYLAVATVLALALHGESAKLPLRPHVSTDPAAVPVNKRFARGIGALPESPTKALDALHSNRTIAAALGKDLVEAYVAVRRQETKLYGDASLEERIELTRWRY